MRIKSIIKNCIPDRIYIKAYYERRMKDKLDYNNPQTFNQKLQWMKAYDHNPLYTKLVDKYEVKEYVRERIGGEYLIPTLGLWDTFDEINFSELPNQFVLKCTHDSGSTVICRDKSTFDLDKAKVKINEHLTHNFYYDFREWPYKNVKPRIIAEPLLEENRLNHISFEESVYAQNPSVEELENLPEHVRFDLFCYRGKVQCFRFKQSMNPSGLFDKNKKSIDASIGEQTYVNKTADAVRKMIGAAEKLAESHNYMQATFYLVNDIVYFGTISIPHQLTEEKALYEKRVREWVNSSDKYVIDNILALFPFTPGEETIHESITDYKFFCFGGKVDNVMIVEDRQSGVAKFFHFSRDWKLLKYNRMGRLLPENSMIKQPPLMNQMIEIAEILSEGLPEVRIDLYEVDGKIYFGEYTFFHHGGYEDGFDYLTNKHMGDLIKLPPKRI